MSGGRLTVRLAAGAVWLFALGALLAEAGAGTVAVFLWTVPAAGVWIALLRREAAGRPRPHGGLWWLVSLTGPFTLLVLRANARPAAQRRTDEPRPSPTTEAAVTTDELLLRLARVEDQMGALQAEVDSIRFALRTRPAPAVQTPAPPRRVQVAPPEPRPSPPLPRPVAPPPPSLRRELDLAGLFGPQALAWAGGVVTLLGVVFFFVLAVDRGWIGPGTRVGCGAVASAIVFLAGLWLRRRFGETYSSLAAVGAGIAGGYATLAAATVLFDLVPKPVALGVAAGIAGASLAVSLAWRAELLAALGLVGAIGAPALLALDGGLTATGTGFAALMTAAALAVGVRMRWPWLLVAAGLASGPQILALVIQAPRNDGGAIALACVFGLLYLVAGISEQLARAEDALAPLPTAFVLGSIAVTWVAALQLFGPAGGLSAGIALLVAAAAFGATTVLVWIRGQRELGTLLGTIALAAGAVGVADALTGPVLAYSFAAEGAVLAVAARRLREPRVLVGSFAYLGLATVHALAFETPPSRLFDATRHPASGGAALVAAAAAALVVGWSARAHWNESPERGVLRFLAPVITQLRVHSRTVRAVAWTLAGALAIDLVSLLVLELVESAWPNGGVVASFHRGHVALTALWSLAGLVAVVAARLRGASRASLLGFAWLGVTALEVLGYDGKALHGVAFSLSFLSLGAALLLAGFLRELLDGRAVPAGETIAAVLVGTALAIASTRPIHDSSHQGLALLAVAAVLLAFAASVFAHDRLRNVSTLLWTPGLALAGVASALVVHGTWLTLAWAAAAAALAGLAATTREKRLQAASFGYLVLTAGSALDESPPSHLLVAHQHPAHAALGLVLLAAAAVAFAWSARNGRAASDDATGYRALAEWLDERQERWRRSSVWAAGIVAVYAASLAILELFVRLSSAGLHTDFQRGHTAVSALWGALGLALLYVGLTRRRRPLRIAGFSLLAVSLGKLFLYDLSQLSSITRALSFLAVGAVLLLAGFFTQRLSAQLREEDGPPAYS